MRALGTFSLAAVMFVTQGSAWAQSEPGSTSDGSGARTERVDELVEQGIALRESGSDARALAIFQQAEQLPRIRSRAGAPGRNSPGPWAVGGGRSIPDTRAGAAQFNSAPKHIQMLERSK